MTIDAEDDGAFSAHLYFHLQRAYETDCLRIQVSWPRFAEDSDRVGLLSSILSETLTYDMPISVREAPLEK